jgi:N-acyl-D-amino-acid deacylase
MTPMPRRSLALGLCLLFCGVAAPPERAPFFPGSTAIPVSGAEFDGVAAWDAPVIAFMRRWDVPGAALAVSSGGHLRVARGYGFADYEARAPMAPATLLRVARLSKPFTAVAVLRLAEQGLLDLDQPVSR